MRGCKYFWAGRCDRADAREGMPSCKFSHRGGAEVKMILCQHDKVNGGCCYEARQGATTKGRCLYATQTEWKAPATSRYPIGATGPRWSPSEEVAAEPCARLKEPG